LLIYSQQSIWRTWCSTVLFTVIWNSAPKQVVNSNKQLYICHSNGPAQSIFYISGCVNGCANNVYLQDSVFIHNKGVPLYISDNLLHISDGVWFEKNTAHAGGSIYSNSSIISFTDKSSVMFHRNIVEANSGAF